MSLVKNKKHFKNNSTCQFERAIPSGVEGREQTCQVPIPFNLAEFSALFILMGLLYSCNPEPRQKPIIVDKAKLKENVINVNKPAVVMENDEINAYIKSHGYVMKITGSGLRFMLIKENKAGQKIIPGREIKVNFKVWLLDGTECYSSDKKGPKKFMVSGDQVESGIHEAVQLMREGEKAVVILPSHLAFGLIGDRDKIPPKSAVVYEIDILEVK